MREIFLSIGMVFDFTIIHKYFIRRREIELRIIYLAKEKIVLEPFADKYFLYQEKLRGFVLEYIWWKARI